MNDSVINIKVKKETKIQAQKIAEEMGFSLSSLMNAYLKQLIRTKTVNVSVEMTPLFKEKVEESSKDIESGNVSPAFDDVDDAIDWLHTADV